MPKSASLQAESKDPFASRNVVLLSLVGIREISGGVVRQAVFVARLIVGARMRNKKQITRLVVCRVVAAKSGSRRSFSSGPHTTPHAGPHEAVQLVVKCDPSET